MPLSRLQQFISEARIPASEPITLHTLISSNIVHGLANKFSGIKLLGDIDPSLPLPPLKLFLSRYSKSAAKAITDAGGEVTAVYRNKLGLRAEKLGATDAIKMADPTRKNDIGECTRCSYPLPHVWGGWLILIRVLLEPPQARLSRKSSIGCRTAGSSIEMRPMRARADMMYQYCMHMIMIMSRCASTYRYRL